MIDARAWFDEDAGRIDYFRGAADFLSNFHPARLVYQGIVYPAAEHAFQAAKTIDPGQRRRIAVCPTPGMAKAAGRRLTLREGWLDMRVDVMREVLEAKFAQNPPLAARLVATGRAYLEEGNSWGDVYWGVCRGRGENMLGLLLMERRHQLQMAIEAVPARPAPRAG